VRSLILPNPLLGGRLMRLALALGRLDDDALVRGAAGIAGWRRRCAAAEIPPLAPVPSDALHERYFARYARSSAGSPRLRSPRSSP
jgi:hypothetical protein